MPAHSAGQLALWSCVAEATAPKAGNVHPDAPFEDTTWCDFMTSAVVIRPVLDGAGERGIGDTILSCIKATHQAVGANTNLGIVLLLAPLCAASSVESLATGIKGVLQNTTERDARLVYEAIALASPGGLGRVEQGDVQEPPTTSLMDAMRLAANHDAVARQYVNGFHDVLHTIAPRFAELAHDGVPLDQAIVRVHLEQMVREPDSLIGRKCGHAVAADSQRRAAEVLEAGWPETTASNERFVEFDHWLRGDAHRRNPGTSADLITAALLAAIHDGHVEPPFAWAQPLAPGES